MDVGKGREHDCMNAGGRATQEQLPRSGSFSGESGVFAGNACSRYRSNRLIPAYRTNNVSVRASTYSRLVESRKSHESSFIHNDNKNFACLIISCSSISLIE